MTNKFVAVVRIKARRKTAIQKGFLYYSDALFWIKDMLKKHKVLSYKIQTAAKKINRRNKKRKKIY